MEGNTDMIVNLEGQDREAVDSERLCGLVGAYFLMQMSDMWLRRQEGKGPTASIIPATIESGGQVRSGYILQKGSLVDVRYDQGRKTKERVKLGVPSAVVLAFQQVEPGMDEFAYSFDEEGVDVVVVPNSSRKFSRGRSLIEELDFDNLDINLNPVLGKATEAGPMTSRNEYIIAAYDRLSQARERLSEGRSLVSYSEMYQILKRKLLDAYEQK